MRASNALLKICVQTDAAGTIPPGNLEPCNLQLTEVSSENGNQPETRNKKLATTQQGYPNDCK
jgi:hypothetical protein